MKKILIITLILLLLISIGTGYLLYSNIKSKAEKMYPEVSQVKQDIIEDDCTAEAEEMLNNDIISANSSTDKVSPNATLVIEKKYMGCNHITKSEVPIPTDAVNMTQEELGEEYTGWQVKEFSKDKLVIYKEFAGICDEHYLVTEKNGYLAIYILDKEENRTLKEVTDISLEYLSEFDLKEIRDGIKIEGKEQLNRLKEDFE